MRSDLPELRPCDARGLTQPRRPSYLAPMARSLVIVESPAKAKTISRFLGDGFEVRALRWARRRSPQQGPCRRRRQRVQADLRADHPRQGSGEGAAGRAEGRGRALPRDRRGSRGRGDLVAPARGAQAAGAREADGVPRDHPRPRSTRRSAALVASTTAWSTRPRPGASSTGSTGTRCRLSCGRRSTRVCRRDECRAPRPGSSSSVSGSASASCPPGYWDIEATSRPIPASPGRSSRTRVERVATGRDFDENGRTKRADVRIVDETLGPRPRHAPRAQRVQRCARSTRSRTGRRRRHRS